jgi:hypothetical protein
MLLRSALGVAQMAGATIGFVLLLTAGITPSTLAVVLGTGVVTKLSILLFVRER